MLQNTISSKKSLKATIFNGFRRFFAFKTGKLGLYHNNILNIDFAMQSIHSWIGHSSHCNSYKLQQKVLNECDFLWNNRAFEHIEKNLDMDIKNFYNNNIEF